MEVACKHCQDISCGCPTHVGWHFYASDCRPASIGGYDDFQRKLDATRQLMEDYPFIQGAIVNEVGMLNCYQAGAASICLPNGPDQMYPAINQPNHACPSTDELPNGLVSFLEHLMDMVMNAKTSDGRSVVAAFSWFNEDMAGGTYNLRLFDDSGNVNDLGRAYVKKCQEWGSGLPPSPSPAPTPPAPSPAPTPMPPPSTCNVGDIVPCPGNARSMCAGNQCCPDGSACPSAESTFSGCPNPKADDCTAGASLVV